MNAAQTEHCSGDFNVVCNYYRENALFYVVLL
jgi:hypothetical protein